MDEIRKIKYSRTFDGQLYNFIHNSELFVDDESILLKNSDFCFILTFNGRTVSYFSMDSYFYEKFNMSVNDARNKIREVLKNELNLIIDQLLVSYK